MFSFISIQAQSRKFSLICVFRVCRLNTCPNEYFYCLYYFVFMSRSIEASIDWLPCCKAEEDEERSKASGRIEREQNAGERVLRSLAH